MQQDVDSACDRGKRKISKSEVTEEESEYPVRDSPLSSPRPAYGVFNHPRWTYFQSSHVKSIAI